MSYLLFSRDGVLRKGFSAYDRKEKTRISRMVPLRAWEEGVDENAFLKSLHSDVSFEDGLTVGELMENLSPWADVMTGLACMDFPAFLKEVRRPERGCEEVSHLEIYYHGTLDAVPKFSRPGLDFKKEKNGLFSLNIGKPVKTDRLYLEEGWDYSAMLTAAGKEQYEGSESISLSFTPMNEYAHLPIFFRRNATFSDGTSWSNKFLTSKRPVFNAQSPLVSKKELSNGKTRSLNIEMDAPRPDFFNALIRGFFWEVGFNYSPVSRDEVAEDLKESIAQLDAVKDGGVWEEKEVEEDNAEFLSDMFRLEKAQAAADKMGLAITVPKPQTAEDD